MAYIMKDGVKYCSSPDIVIDSELSTISTNPVQNKVIANALEEVGAGLTEITYAEYLANKAEYDASGKAYAIPDYPYSGGGLKDMTYTLLDNDTHDWKIYFPTMVVSNGIAHLCFRLQTGKDASYSTNTWTQVLQLSVKPKSNVYGITNTYSPKTERFSAYIDTNGILCVTPNTSYTGVITLEIMFIFVVNV